jgi:hypothetical protein
VSEFVKYLGSCPIYQTIKIRRETAESRIQTLERYDGGWSIEPGFSEDVIQNRYVEVDRGDSHGAV